MDERYATIAAELAKLREAYRARLPQEVAELTDLANGLMGEADTRQRLETLHHRLHKLAGSGGTFGLDSLSRQARVLEDAVHTWLAGDLTAVNEAQRRSLAEAVAALATVAD